MSEYFGPDGLRCATASGSGSLLGWWCENVRDLYVAERLSKVVSAITVERKVMVAESAYVEMTRMRNQEIGESGTR